MEVPTTAELYLACQLYCHLYDAQHFVDASSKAYGAAAYLSHGFTASLLMAKKRVAPLRPLTVPQLELMAAVIGVRLSNHLTKSFAALNTVYWSDSHIVLQWLSTSKPLKMS